MRWSVGVAVAILTLSAAGCGDDDTGGSDPTTTTTTTAATPTSAPTTVTTGADPTVTTGASSTSTAVPSGEAGAVAVATAFFDARVAGSGAEEHLTDNGASIYPGEIPLYDVAAYDIGAVEGADANSFEITVSVTTVDGSARTETIGVGPGENVDGENRPFVVRFGVVSA